MAGGKPDLNNTFKKLLPLAHQWDMIGTLLGIPSHTTDRIKADGGGVARCLHEMLSEWIKCGSHQTTWTALADAVKHFDPSKALEIQETCID